MSDPNDDAANQKATVKLFYKKPERQVIAFSRTVMLAGSSKYSVNGKKTNLEEYNKELAKIGILDKARNFFVLQNEVESIASKSAKELTAKFEEVGSQLNIMKSSTRLWLKKALPKSR